MLRVLLLSLLVALPAAAEEVVVGLSQNRISITTNFDGSEILAAMKSSGRSLDSATRVSPARNTKVLAPSPRPARKSTAAGA